MFGGDLIRFSWNVGKNNYFSMNIRFIINPEKKLVAMTMSLADNITTALEDFYA